MTNLQGDVLKIVYKDEDDAIQVAASYTYDPYGKVLTATGTLAEVNPLRYRGYVYDSETGFYYLQSRYYDPTICRFINADSYASTGQGIIGHNMFAYCNNNPTTYTDNSGAMACNTFLGDNHIFSDMFLTGGYGGCGGSGDRAISASKAASEKVIENEIAFFTNTSEDVVLDAEYFAFYKGALVIYHSSEYLTSWAWGGVIFLNRDSKNETTLSHEYGHILREREYGTVKYTFSVFLPSAAYNISSRFNSTLHDNYYNMPWEYDAEVNGNVNRAYNYADWAPSLRELYFKIWERVYYA